MTEAESLVIGFLKKNGYGIRTDYSGALIVDHVECSEHVVTTTFLAFFVVRDHYIMMSHISGYIKNVADDLKQFSLYSEEDFNSMLEYLKKRKRFSYERMHSTSTGWQDQEYTMA